MPKISIIDKTTNMKHVFETSLDVEFVQKLIDSTNEEQLEMLLDLVENMELDNTQKYMISKLLIEFFNN